MKRFAMAAAAVLFSLVAAVSLTGCDEVQEIVDEVAGPSETWCTMPVTYTHGENSVSLNVTFYYSDSELKSNDNSTGLRTKSLYKADDSGESIPAGITILVTTGDTSNSVVSSLTKTTYILKTFESVSDLFNAAKDENETSDSSSSSYSTMQLLWTAIYRSKSELRSDKSTSIPAQLQKSTQDTYSPITDLSNFSWKTLLKTYLINSL